MRFSIIIPVLNEEAVLDDTLTHLSKICAQQDCELLIVDGGSCDRTVAIAERFGRVITAARGRASQMNTGASAARGDALIFLHADTQLPSDVFKAIEQTLAKPFVVGGAFKLCFNCDLWSYRLVAFATNLRSRIQQIYTGDQTFFIRASSFHAIGGFPDQPLMEDIEIITQLRKLGRVVLLSQYVTTSARRHKKIGLFRSVLFMWYLRTLYRIGVSPANLQRMYIDIR